MKISHLLCKLRLELTVGPFSWEVKIPQFFKMWEICFRAITTLYP